ncbi:hypothetical protein [Pseudomonas kuykendallii]|uniref:hypothetical protein n=1 Tax=Pseudomonas kuykendallii TaxID=1007099 RepID=UPI0028D69B69|nr:hypothetical protein [Pseudomonas kuykendallii]
MSITEVTLPMSCVVNGRLWNLYTFQYKTPDGEFCGYLHAVSDEHAAALLADMKETAELKGQIIEAGI